MGQRVLVLNASYEPLQLISIRRAVVLLLQEKAELVEATAQRLRAQGFSLEIPLVIRLVHQSSVMQQLEENSSYHELSKHEHALLQRAFGRVPW